MVISFSAVCFTTFWQGVGGGERNLLFMLGMWFPNASKFFSYIWFPLESLMAHLFTAGYFPGQIPLRLKNTVCERWVKETFSYTKKLFTYYPLFFPHFFLKVKRPFSGHICRKLRSSGRRLSEWKLFCSPDSRSRCAICFRSTKEA